MKILRTISGIGLLFSSPMWGRILETLTGYTELWGGVTVTLAVAFIGGTLFYSGVSN